jgi:hypothetical protein
MKKKDFVKSVMTILDNFKADSGKGSSRKTNFFQGYTWKENRYMFVESVVDDYD